MSDSSDASAKRGQHFLGVLEQGQQLVNELLVENERLRSRWREVQSKLEMDPSVDLPTLEGEVDHVIAVKERERREALQRVARLEEEIANIRRERVNFSQRQEELERQNANLASLYVASYGLHESLNFDAVLAVVKEVIVNLFGSEDFGIYRFSPPSTLALIAHEGEVAPEVGADVTAFEIVREALRSRSVTFTTVLEEKRVGEPLTIVPLQIENVVVGAIVVFNLLPHKSGLEASDYELLEFLSGQAAAALCGALLYGRSQMSAEKLHSLFVEAR